MKNRKQDKKQQQEQQMASICKLHFIRHDEPESVPRVRAGSDNNAKPPCFSQINQPTDDI